MNESILTTVKKYIGFDEDYTVYDPDLMILINSAFSVLNQLGIGPATGYRIESKDEKWDDFLYGDLTLEDVKDYVCLKVKLRFDPPSNSFTLDAMNKDLKELEWRISIMEDVSDD